MATSSGSQLCWWFFSSIVLVSIPGALCDDGYSIGGLVAAAAICFLLLAVIIAMVAAGVTWNSWYPKLQWAKGKVKMPRAYWKKKEEAKLKLLHGSRSALASLAAPSDSGLPNGNVSSRVLDTAGSLKASWVQGWNNANHMGDGGYEEMALAMDLGEEDREDDVCIITTVMDNEALDLGPFKDTDPPPAATSTATGAARAASLRAREEEGGSGGAGAVSNVASSQRQPPSLVPTRMTEEELEAEAADSYIYSTVDRSTKKSFTSTSMPRGADIAETDADAETAGDEGPAATSEKVTSFSKMDPYLVAL